MNLDQNIILILVIIILIVMGLFPPYLGIESSSNFFLGYHPFFEPPPKKISKRVGTIKLDGSPVYGIDYYPRIDTQRLTIQVIFLFITISSLMLVFNKSFKMGNKR